MYKVSVHPTASLTAFFAQIFAASSAFVSLALAQNSARANCCPRACSNFSVNMCCKACPAECNEAPSQNKLSVVQENCSQSVLVWTTPDSCAPITKMDVQCHDYLGRFQDLPAVFGDRSQWMIENDHLRAAPFNL